MRNFFKIFVIALAILTTQNITFAQANLDDIRQAAKIFYVANKSPQAQAKILEIPENERSANDYLLLGNFLQDMGNKKDAISAYNKAILIDKTFYQAYYNLAGIYLGDYEDKEAVQYYKLAIKYKKDFPYSYYNLGCAYLEMGDAEKAKKSFEKAIAIKIDEPKFYYNLAFAHKQLGDNVKAKKAVDLYNQLIQKRVDEQQ